MRDQEENVTSGVSQLKAHGLNPTMGKYQGAKLKGNKITCWSSGFTVRESQELAGLGAVRNCM